MAVVLADSTWKPPVKGGAWRLLARIREAEQPRRLVWSPVLLSFGIFGYFGLEREPPIMLSASLGAVAVLLLWWKRGSLMATAVALVIFGFGLAGMRTAWLNTPMLTAYEQGVSVTGWLSNIERRGSASGTLVIDVTSYGSSLASRAPARVSIRVNLKRAPALSIGDRVQVTADLWPLPRPAAPGSFDFGRQLYFQGIGAQGQGKEIVLLEQDQVPLRYQLRRAFHDLRTVIGERIRSAVKGPLASVAEALITGERANIPRALNDSLQASGLFHILSISGLHMSLVVGGAFWLVRAVLAAMPQLALRYPIKKWAAAAALAAGLFYNLLADSGAATERSFIMIAVVLFAVIVDRPAISLHNLAVAALIILLREPEQAIQASFQMSFMAVMGLAAFFPHLSSYVRHKPLDGFMARWAHRLLMVAAGSFATSIIAGTLSSIPAMHHFGRIAPFGVVANALALPVVSVVVMPMAMVSVLLMPFGWETLPLSVMVWGLDLVMDISKWIAGWPLAASRWPLLDAPRAYLFALSGVLLCLPASTLRVLSVPALVAALLMPSPAKPLLLFDERGMNAAVLTDQGYALAESKGGSATASRWLRDSGDELSMAEAARRPGWQCGATACFAKVEGWTVAYLPRTAETNFLCPAADIILAAYPLRHRCKGKHLTLDRFDVWRDGTIAIASAGTSLKIATSRASQGFRPWAYQSTPRARRATTYKSP